MDKCILVLVAGTLLFAWTEISGTRLSRWGSGLACVSMRINLSVNAFTFVIYWILVKGSGCRNKGPCLQMEYTYQPLSSCLKHLQKLPSSQDTAEYIDCSEGIFSRIFGVVRLILSTSTTTNEPKTFVIIQTRNLGYMHAQGSNKIHAPGVRSCGLWRLISWLYLWWYPSSAPFLSWNEAQTQSMRPTSVALRGRYRAPSAVGPVQASTTSQSCLNQLHSNW